MSDEETVAFLSSMNTGVLCLSEETVPYAVPLHFAFDPVRNVLYMHSAQEGEKVRICKLNPAAVFVVFENYGLKLHESPCKIGTRYRSAIVKGKIASVVDEGERRSVLKAFSLRVANNDNNFSDESLQRVLLLRLDIGEITGKQDQPQATPR